MSRSPVSLLYHHVEKRYTFQLQLDINVSSSPPPPPPEPLPWWRKLITLLTIKAGAGLLGI